MDSQQPPVSQQPTNPSNEGERLTKRQRRELRRQERRSEQLSAQRKKNVGKYIWIALLVVLVGGFVTLIALSGDNPPSGGTDLTLDTTDPARGASRENALVVVREYSDFQCPACRSAIPLVNSLVEKYGDTVRFEFNDFPLTSIHRNSLLAANAGQCALDQDKFWEFHDKMFDTQPDWSNLDRTGARAKFITLAADVGADQDRFTACLDDETFRDRVQNDINEGTSNKVNSTPSFFVDSTLITGVSSASLTSAIDAALDAAGARATNSTNEANTNE